ncbi:MAG: hypothetical protein ACRDG3_09145 [Tepidiformaceae bacterium]
MLNDDIGTARRTVHERERLAAQRQLQHEVRTEHPSAVTRLLARLADTLRQRRRTGVPEFEPRPVRLKPDRKPARRSPGR